MNPDDNTYNDKRHRREEHQRVVDIAKAREYIETEECTRAEKLTEEGDDDKNQAARNNFAGITYSNDY